MLKSFWKKSGIIYIEDFRMIPDTLPSMCPNEAPNVDLKGPSDPARRLKIIDFSEPGSLLPPPTKIGNQRVSEAKKSQRLAFRMTKPIAEGAGVEEGSIFQSRSQPMVFYFCGR